MKVVVALIDTGLTFGHEDLQGVNLMEFDRFVLIAELGQLQGDL